METLKTLFAEKNYDAVKSEIYADSDYQNNPFKLRFLVSAFYYSRDYNGTIAAIELLKPHDLKTAYSMLINNEISLGSSADTALEYIQHYLNQQVTQAERSWAYFQRGLCYLAKGEKKRALEMLAQANPLENDLMEAERHFFLNNTSDNYQGGTTELEKINQLIVEARLEKEAGYAREARDRAFAVSYGEAEYFATVVLAKYFGIHTEKLNLNRRFGAVEHTIYYRII